MKKRSLIICISMVLMIIAVTAMGCHSHAPINEWKSDSTGHWHECESCDEKVDFMAHTYSEEAGSVAGKIKYVCDICSFSYEQDHQNHTLGELMVQEATCAAEGKKYKVCSECNAEVVEELLEKIKHSTSRVETVTPGKIKYECKNCDYWYEREHTSHTEGSWIIDENATCSKEGSRHKECSQCKLVTKTEAISVLPHECTESAVSEVGKALYECKNCEYSEVLDHKSHTSSDWIEDYDSTCKETGSRHKECLLCRKITNSDVIAKKEHEYVNMECVGCGKPDTRYPKEWTDENDTFTFAMISDIHLQILDRGAEQNFAKAIEECLNNTDDLDAIVISGDLADVVWYGPNLYFEDGVLPLTPERRRQEILYIDSVIQKYVPKDMPVLFCLGNHDQYGFAAPGGFGATYSPTQGWYNILSSSPVGYYDYDYEISFSDFMPNYFDDMLRRGTRYAKLGTNHFILADANQYWSVDSAFSDIQLEWIRDTLDYIDTTYPGEPIYFITHDPVLDSVYGSTGTWGNNCLKDVLDDYNQVTLFAGHIHYSNYHQAGINQEYGFTCVEASSVKYTGQPAFAAAGESGYNVKYSSGADTASSQGLLVEVAKDTSMTINRMDFENKKSSGKPWTLPSVSDQTRNIVYTKEYLLANNVAPSFEGGIAPIAQIDGSYLTVSFPKAIDNSSVAGYIVTAKRSNGSETTLRVENAFAVSSDIPVLDVSFENAENVIKVSITPVDDLGVKGEPIALTSEFFTSYVGVEFEGVDSKQSTLGNVDLGDVKIFGFDEFWCEDETYTTIGSAFSRANTYFNAYLDSYEFGYNVSNMIINKAHTVDYKADRDLSLGANLATFAYGSHVYSICAYFEFDQYNDNADGTLENDPNYNASLNHLKTGKMVYKMLVYGNGGKSYCTFWSLGDGATFLDLYDELIAAFRSEEGANVRVERKGTTFDIYVGDELIDSKDFGGYYYRNGYLCNFTTSTKSTFGASTWGADAIYKNAYYEVK